MSDVNKEAYPVYLLACARAATGGTSEAMLSDARKMAAQTIGVRDGLAMRDTARQNAYPKTREEVSKELDLLMGTAST